MVLINQGSKGESQVNCLLFVVSVSSYFSYISSRVFHLFLIFSVFFFYESSLCCVVNVPGMHTHSGEHPLVALDQISLTDDHPKDGARPNMFSSDALGVNVFFSSFSSLFSLSLP